MNITLRMMNENQPGGSIPPLTQFRWLRTAGANRVEITGLHPLDVPLGTPFVLALEGRTVFQGILQSQTPTGRQTTYLLQAMPDQAPKTLPELPPFTAPASSVAQETSVEQTSSFAGAKPTSPSAGVAAGQSAESNPSSGSTISSTNSSSGVAAGPSAEPNSSTGSANREGEADLVNLTSCIFEGSVNVQTPPQPGDLRIHLQAEWLQKMDGCLDLGTTLAAAFPKGKVNSLNANLQWAPRPLRSDYTVVRAAFERVAAPQTGALGIYPEAMPPLTCGKETVQLPRHWFQATWKLMWSYEQKRVERLTLSCPFGQTGDPLDLSLKVTDVESIDGFTPQRATLAAPTLPERAPEENQAEEPQASQREPQETNVWEAVAKEAIQTLKPQLLQRFSSKISVKLPFEVALGLNLGQRVQFQFEGRTLQGKIVRLELQANGPRRVASLTLESIPDWLSTWCQTRWEMGPMQETSKLQGLTAPLTPEDGVDLTVEHHAEDQYDLLQQAQPKSKAEVRQILRQHPTRIRIRLKPLRTTRHLSHDLTASLYPASP